MPKFALPGWLLGATFGLRNPPTSLAASVISHSIIIIIIIIIIITNFCVTDNLSRDTIHSFIIDWKRTELQRMDSDGNP